MPDSIIIFTIAAMPSLLCRLQILVGWELAQSIPTVVHTVRSIPTVVHTYGLRAPAMN